MVKHDIIEEKLCKEISTLEDKLTVGEMTVQDLDKLDKLYHTLKSKAAYDSMKEPEEYDEPEHRSYRRPMRPYSYAPRAREEYYPAPYGPRW